MAEGNVLSAAPNCRAELIEDDQLLLLTLSNGRSNAITPSLLDEIGRTLDDVEAMGVVRGVVVQGTGSTFSKGFDVDVIENYPTATAHRRDLLLGNDVCSRISASRVPWIAAINGHCLGAGLEIALACHIRLGIEGARYGLPELSRGLLPGLGGASRLTKVVGRSKALEMILGGSLIDSAEAHRIGLINRLFPKSSFSDAVLAFARNVVSVEPELTAEVMQLTSAAEMTGHEDGIVETVERVLNRWKPRDPGEVL